MKTTATTAILATLAVFAGARASALTIGDGTYTSQSDYEAADKIIKTGTGVTTLDFGSSTRPSFTGEIEVQQGTLKVAASLLNLGTPSKITVYSGATLDMSETAGTATAMSSTEFAIAGTGVNDAGALCRTTGNNANDFFNVVTLSGDALVKFSMQLGFKNVTNGTKVNLNGHTLSVDVSGTVLYAPYVQFKDNGAATHGGIRIVAGTFFPRYSALTEGTADNVLTLCAGATLRFRDLSVKPKWKIVTVDGATTFDADQSSSQSTANTWSGPVEAGGKITMSAASGAYFRIDGGITNCNELMKRGVGRVTVSGTNYLGEIRNEGSGTLVLDRSRTWSDNRLSLLNGTTFLSNSVLRLDFPVRKNSGIGSDVDRPFFAIRDGSTVWGNDLGADGASALFYIGMTAGKYGQLEMEAGTVMTNVTISLGTSGYGAFYQKGGSLYWPTGKKAENNSARDVGSYAYYGIGGDFVVRPYDNSPRSNSEKLGVEFGRNGTIVFAVRDGGRFALTNGKTNRTVFASQEGRVDYYQNNGATCEIEGYLDFGNNEDPNHDGSMVFTVEGEGSTLRVMDPATNSSAGFRMLWTPSVAASGIVNVNRGGTIETPFLYCTAARTAWYLNMNGGVICPNAASGTFIYSDSAARMPRAATVYEGGVTIDTSHAIDAKGDGVRVMWPITLVAPGEGRRVASIALPTDPAYAGEAANLIGSPVVTITGAGAGASAFALYDEVNRVITNIVVTNPGWGYADGTTTATLSAGGLKNSYVCAVTLEDPPTTGWKGLVKRGMQPLRFAGTNELVVAHSFKGDITVEEGAIYYDIASAAQGGMPEGAGLNLWENGAIVFPTANTAVTVPFLAGSGTVSNGYVTVTERIEVSADDIFAGKHLRLGRNLTLADGVTVVIKDPENLVNYYNSKAVAVVEAGIVSGGLACAGTVNFAFGAPCSATDTSRWVLNRKGNAIMLGAARGTIMIMR